MCNNEENNVISRHSFCLTRSPKVLINSESWKSDTDIIMPASSEIRPKKNSAQVKNGGGEYYKRYEHDEVPVKDDSYSIEQPVLSDTGTGDGHRMSLTSSHLEKLELNVFQNISQELQTDENSTSSLESNIKFFKTTVEEILKNFNSSMRDFEIYKRRFNEILNKNRQDSLDEMEDFIKDMIQNILSSESVSNESHKLTNKLSYNINVTEQDSIESTCSSEHEQGVRNFQSIVESYKNINYLTDSTFDRHSSNEKPSTKKDDVFNIYLLTRTPCLDINLNERNLLSESHIKDASNEEVSQFASAENLKKLAAKKIELEKYITDHPNGFETEREIPVKESYAKKNIYLNEDFVCDSSRSDNKSFISKICHYLCKKFRRNSLT